MMTRAPVFCTSNLLLLIVVAGSGHGQTSSATASCRGCGGENFCFGDILKKVQSYIDMNTRGTDIHHFIDQMELECGSSRCSGDDNKTSYKGIWFTEIWTKSARTTFYSVDDGWEDDSPLQLYIEAGEIRSLPSSQQKCSRLVDSGENFHYPNIVQSDKCLQGNNCAPLSLASCDYSVSYCANDIQSKLSLYRVLYEKGNDDVILFADHMVIRQRCGSNTGIFTPSPAIKGIGITKVQNKMLQFQFFPVGNEKIKYTRTFSMEEGTMGNLTLQCESAVNLSESWNQSRPIPCQDGDNNGIANLLNVIAGLFRKMSSKSKSFETELVFTSGSIVQRSVISVDTSTNFNWKIHCETIPDTTSSSTTSTLNHARTEAQTTDDDKSKITSTHLAIATSLSFLAGAILMLLLLFILRYMGKTDICLRKKDDKRQVKWDGIANNISTQESEEQMAQGGQVVNAVSHPNYDGRQIYSKLNKGRRDSDHVYDTSKDAYEKLDTSASDKLDMRSDEHVYNAAQSTYQSLADPGLLGNTHKGNEHVYSGIDDQQRARPANKTESGTEVPNNTLDKPENLFENRESATSEHNYFTLQNDNFRLTNAVDESQATAAQGTADPDTYFVLEKERKDVEDGVKPAEKEGNTYFTLEKHEPNTENETENGTVETNADDHAYFVLENP